MEEVKNGVSEYAINSPICGKVGAVYKTINDSILNNGLSTTRVDEFMYHTHNRRIDRNKPLLVKVDGKLVSDDKYTLDYQRRFITFKSAQAASAVITIDVYILEMAPIASVYNWKLEMNSDIKDVTTFGSKGWKENLPILKGWSCSAEGYWANKNFIDAVGTEICIELYVQNTPDSSYGYRGFSIMTKNSIETPVDDVVKENIEFSGSNELLYFER